MIKINKKSKNRDDGLSKYTISSNFNTPLLVIIAIFLGIIAYNLGRASIFQGLSETAVPQNSSVASSPQSALPTSVPQNNPVVKTNQNQVVQPSPTPSPKSVINQSEYLNKAKDTIRRIDTMEDKYSDLKYKSMSDKTSCVDDSCRSSLDAIIKTADNFLDAGKKSRDWLRQIIDFIDKGGVLNDDSKKSIDKMYDFYN